MCLLIRTFCKVSNVAQGYLVLILRLLKKFCAHNINSLSVNYVQSFYLKLKFVFNKAKNYDDNTAAIHHCKCMLEEKKQ